MKQQILQLGKQEVLSLDWRSLWNFVLDRYWRGPSKNFHYHACNPSSLSTEQAQHPATILLHASDSNQGQWIPLLQTLQARCCPAPIFSINFNESSDLQKLIEKIESIRELYLAAGQTAVDINLVGHSYGAICSADYAFSPELWPEYTRVRKVISIAGRLKNIDPPLETPYYPYSYYVLKRVDRVWKKIQELRGSVELYTIAAEQDWLLPIESVLVGDDEAHQALIPNQGHVLISHSPETLDLVAHWLTVQ